MSEQTEAFGRTIQLFLVDGVPSGLIIASIHGWTGSVLVASQATFDKLRARPEADRTGLYILFGPDPDDALSMRAYIGEADCVKDRINQSAENRAFWETAVIITTSDEALTKGHVRYLEARLIEVAGEAGRVKLDNGQLPKPDRRRLPEADRANMEAFLSNLRVILPVVGLDLLKPKPRALAAPGDTAKADGGPKFEIRHWSEVQATAIEEDGEFVVLEGSQALKNAGYVGANSYGELKKELIAQGVLTADEGATVYTFAKPYVFTSPSAASAVILDRNSNGRREWRVVGSKLTYHEWQEQKTKQEDAHE
ncbi:GIY-YIG nuclease family protein [Xanthobacter versatilis]|uniref:GIY-YIG nuclease family protein n=1 Tax=Xanthobacter autotrophicus (strain ATCC BAA-1158 / Py2) TaxID=78245 RepID=UPI0037266978